MMRRSRLQVTAIRVAVAAVPFTFALAFAGAATAGPLQPGVTKPDVQAQSDQPAADEPAELHSAAPQQAPAPRSAPRAKPAPEKPEDQPPAPRSVRIGEFSAPVPDVVPDAVVDGVNRATDGVQGAITPGHDSK
ncbi:hypothetical protein [Nocardia nova]|nr:hypothetical protein [Nocardia nova]